ncbi:MAG: signal peptidase I [Pirellulaceae bacterium]|nr:signal peptidase I [Pirellulaceae bacterium]
MALISVLFAGLVIASLAVSILTLVVCGRLFRAEKATLGRAAAVCVILAVPSPLALLWSNRLSQTHVLGLAMLPLVQVLAAWLLIRWLLGTGSGKAALITATWMVTSTALSVALALTCRATVAEAFSVPTGAMAPTIFGQHVRKTCERCGYEFPVGASFRPYDPDATAVASCTNCGATVEVSPSDPTVSGDRILVSKLDAPRRWDLVVFPPPTDTSTMYVKRLIGLPGETIEIRGGDLYANGRRLQKPPGTLDEFWLPVHDTYFGSLGSPPEESPRWFPTDEPSGWTWQPVQGWQYQGGPEQRGELGFSHPVSDVLAYNAEIGRPGRATDAARTPGEVLVSDLEIAAHVTRAAGSGVWGFLWEWGANRVTASIGADAAVRLVHRTGEPGQDDRTPKDEVIVSGQLVAPPAGSTVRFAVRDAQAYLMQDRQLIAVLPLPNAPAGVTSEDDARPVVKLFAEGGELQLSRIQLYRDVYYLTAEQADPYGMPGISNPISLGADQYLVLGDNSRMSRDARFFGPIPTHSVKGVVRCTYWPPRRIRTFVPPAAPAER